MEFGKKRVFKQEQPLRVCGENWVWFDAVLSVSISHVGHAAFTLCHSEVIFGVLPSKGCCTAHALAVQWTHISLPTRKQEAFPQVRAANCAAENFTLPAKEEVLACACPRIQGAQLRWEEKRSKMWEKARAAWWLIFKFGGRLRCAFVWKFLLLRTL